ncbi:MAG: ThiF family adenylyltransferase [Thermotogota bacterium]|nr:ThiF family adenylyltransferase [Thermotogota bacterium]
MDMESEFLLNWYERQLLVKGIDDRLQLKLSGETFGRLTGELEELVAELLIRSGLSGITKEFPRQEILPFYSPLIYRQEETVIFEDGPLLEIVVEKEKKRISFPHSLPSAFAPIIAGRIFSWFMDGKYEKAFNMKLPAGLDRIGRPGKVMVVGAGGLGAPLIKILLDRGLKDIAIVEPGEIKLNNLHRQILYDYGDVGYPKATILERKLSRMYPSARVKIYRERFTEALLRSEEPDLVVSCVDNYGARYEINDSSYRSGIPYVDSAVDGFSGYVMFRRRGLACYRCFMGDDRKDTTAPKGILPFTSYFGAMLQAAVTIDFLNRRGSIEKVFWFDLRNDMYEEIDIGKRENCKVCN